MPEHPFQHGGATSGRGVRGLPLIRKEFRQAADGAGGDQAQENRRGVVAIVAAAEGLVLSSRRHAALDVLGVSPLAASDLKWSCVVSA